MIHVARRRLIVPAAAAAGPTTLYIANGNNNVNQGSLYRANLSDGTGLTQLIGSLTGSRHIATDGTWLYYGGGASNAMGRCALDGSSNNASWAALGETPLYGVQYGGTLYWGASGAAHFSKLVISGQVLTAPFITVNSQFGGHGICTDGSHIFYADATTSGGPPPSYVRRTAMDGTGVSTLVTGLSGHTAMAIDATYIYWTDANTNAIGRAKLDGSGANTSFVSPGTGTVGLAVDSAHIYWSYGSNPSNSYIGRCNLDGTGVTTQWLSLAGWPSGAFPTAIMVN